MMRLFRDSSIKGKLIQISLLTSLVSLLLSTGLLITYGLLEFQRSSIDHLTVQANIIGNNSTASLVFNDPKAEEEILGALRAAPNIVYAVIYTKEGRIFAHYLREKAVDRFSPPLPQKEGHHFGMNHLMLFQPIILDGETIGTICIQSDLRELYSHLRGFAGISLIIAIISLSAGFLGLLKLHRVIIKPIQDLVRLMLTVSKEKNYSVRASIHRQDELGSLSEGFNGMLAQIQNRDVELELHRKHLEDQVVRRTEELVNANERLGEELSERKRAEEELQKLAAVVRYSSEFVNLATLDGKMVFLNEAGAKMLGISPAEIEQTTIMQITPDHLKEKVQNELLPALMNNGTWEGDLQYLNLKTGQLTDVHSMSFMIKEAVTGAPLFLANVSLNITEQKELEVALHRAKQEADRANRAKSIFLANMSHEIRTPMNAILGFSQLMQRDPEVTPRQRKQLDTINRSGEHLLALINDILEISKIEAGRVTLNLTAFDLHALLNDLEMMFRLRTDAKNLQFSVERIGEVPRFVVSDEGKLRQVLINLLGNAVKFTKKGGIILRARARHEETKGLRLMIEVEDTGPGIAAEDMGRLFHHFEQTETGRKSGTGTGLGLAISSEFVRLMGGDISVSSKVDRGSLFGFNIALKEANPAAVAVKAESRPATGLQPGQPQYRVLVADDKEDNRELLSQMLGPIGFQIRQAANGEDSVKQFETWGPSLILMDLRMPVMDGYEAIRRIRASTGGKDTRIIAVTASAFEEARQEVLADGADDFVSKPFRETELIEKIGRLLGVKYVYAEAVSVTAKPEALEALTSESLTGLPGELIRQIREATINADLDRMLELIQQTATHDARVANGLRSLAERFDYQKLLDLLPTGGTTHGTANES